MMVGVAETAFGTHKAILLTDLKMQLRGHPHSTSCWTKAPSGWVHMSWSLTTTTGLIPRS
jgi:hypothetical protein